MKYSIRVLLSDESLVSHLFQGKKRLTEFQAKKKAAEMPTHQIILSAAVTKSLNSYGLHSALPSPARSLRSQVITDHCSEILS